MTISRVPSRSRRGSLLIVAMLLSAIVAIALTSYIQLSRTTLNISNRAFYHNAAMNLAEQGLEEAMYSVNKTVFDSTYNFGDWTLSSGDARREWTGVELSQGATATFRAYVYNFALANPAPKIVVARSRVTLAGVASAPVEKWIQVALRKTSKFANGLVAKQTITFNGQNTLDSWNSDPDNNPATAAIPYDPNPGAGIRRSNTSVASASVAVGSVAVNSADIFGFVATGGAAPSVGSQGKITGNFNAGQGTVDPGRVDTNFTATFDPVTAPPPAYFDLGGSITVNTTLPRATDSPNGTGIYAGYYMYEAVDVNLINAALTISGKVVLKLTNPLDAMNIGGGTGALNIDPGAKFEAYGSGDFKIAGLGIMNGGTTLATANQPINCQFYGTKTVGVQDFKIAGNGVLSAVVYAPNASLDINGNGDVLGSFVANDIDFNGTHSAFHYDESLAKYGVRNPYRISNWRELTTAAERNSTVASVVNW
jgi:hypothetical protein